MKKSICLLILIACSIWADEPKIALVAITKDEHHFITEWITYHHLIGVSHFYIYDNNESNLTAKVLKPYIDSGLVDYCKWPNRWPEIVFHEGCQLKAYEDAAPRAIGKYDWIGMIDTDEFLVPMQENDLASTMGNYFSESGAVYISWKNFGTSHKYIPSREWLILNLTQCSNESHFMNAYGKILIRPELFVKCVNTHFFVTLCPYVNGNAEPIEAPGYLNSDNYSDKFLRINHYVYRDQQFFDTVKIGRLEMQGRDLNHERSLNEDFCQEEDTKILEVLHHQIFNKIILNH